MKLNVDRIMSRYIFIVLILMLSGCSPVNRQKIRVESGLDYGESRDCILFLRPSIGLMGGVCVRISMRKPHNLKESDMEYLMQCAGEALMGVGTGLHRS